MGIYISWSRKGGPFVSWKPFSSHLFLFARVASGIYNAYKFPTAMVCIKCDLCPLLN